MPACHRLTSQICARSKALRCQFAVKGFSEIIYRDRWSLPTVILLLAVPCYLSCCECGLSSTKYFVSFEQAQECWNCLFGVQGFEFKLETWDMERKKKKKKTPEWRKRTVGLWHPISSAKEMLQHTLVIHSLLRKPPPCSIWTAEVVSHKVKYQKELPNVNPKTYIGKQTFLGGEQDPAGSNSGVHRRVSLYRDTTTTSHWCRWTIEPSLCHSTSSCTEIVRSAV